MECLFNAEIIKQFNQAEFDALLQEFRTDYNRTHFVWNPEFKEPPTRCRDRSARSLSSSSSAFCTAEFSGFLLYKELDRRLKKTNPVVAKIFSLMCRDETRICPPLQLPRSAPAVHPGSTNLILGPPPSSTSAAAARRKARPRCQSYRSTATRPELRIFNHLCRDNNHSHRPAYTGSKSTAILPCLSCCP